MTSLGETFVTKSYDKKVRRVKGKAVKAPVVKADYGNSGTNRAYAVTGKKVGKRVSPMKTKKGK